MNKELIKNVYDTIVSEAKYFNTCIDGNASNLEYLAFRLLTPYHLAVLFNDLRKQLENSTFVDVEDENGEIYAAINPNIDLLRLVVNNTKRYYLKTYSELWKIEPEKVLESMHMWLYELWDEDEDSLDKLKEELL